MGILQPYDPEEFPALAYDADVIVKKRMCSKVAGGNWVAKILGRTFNSSV